MLRLLQGHRLCGRGLTELDRNQETVAVPIGANPSGGIHQKWPFFVLAQRSLDIIVIPATFTVVRYFVGPDPHFGSHRRMLIYVIVIISQIFISRNGCYSRRSLANLNQQLQGLLLALLCTAMAVLGTSTIDGFKELVDVRELSAALGGCLVLMIFSRLVLCRCIARLRARGAMRERIALLGAGSGAKNVIEHLAKAPTEEVATVGLFDDRNTPRPAGWEECPFLGTTDDLIAMARLDRIDRIVVTLPWTADSRLAETLSKLRTVPCAISLCPASPIWDLGSAEFFRFAGIPLITVANHKLSSKTELFKWFEDKIIAAILLVILAPLMLFIALLVKVDSSGPILFRQKRLGYNNQTFDILKFRTMRPQMSAGGDLTQAKRRDPRVTRIGMYLRRTSLDELPQLFNVLRGEMSLVGPRPHAVEHNTEFAAHVEGYFARHNLKPGITGWAQVHGFRGEIDSPAKIRSRVQYDMHYIENWTIQLDLKILLITAASVWFHRTAY
jgi:Undecaprenyl-phosphate glucose phosphotransferase